MSTVDKPTLSTDAMLALPERPNVLDSPISPSSPLALSRFEFEAGRGNEGTKVLMVEWDASSVTRGRGPDAEEVTKGDGAEEAGAEELATRDIRIGAGGYSEWEVSWEGKTSVLPVHENDLESHGDTRCVYFLLPPGAPIPPTVSITRRSASSLIGSKRGSPSSGTHGPILHTKPLPAIFTAELPGGCDVGRRGVLHTLWAKKRMAELQAEITTEMRLNGEGIGLEMALQERQWVVDHFGLTPVDVGAQPTRLHILQLPTSPATPRSPIGGRLGEKLRGLKLSTSPADLAAASQAARNSQQGAQTLQGSLSPEASDLVIPSFSSGTGWIKSRDPRHARDGGIGNTTSLDVLVRPGIPTTVQEAKEDGLFALPMSPRSPEMRKSPFSSL